MDVTNLAIVASGLSLIGLALTVIGMWSKLDDERQARRELEDTLRTQRKLRDQELYVEAGGRGCRPPTNDGPDDGWGL